MKAFGRQHEVEERFRQTDDELYEGYDDPLFPNAKMLAGRLKERGADLVAGGTDTHLALVVSQHRLAGGELLEHQLLHRDARLVDARQHVLVVRARARDDVYVRLETLCGHADRIVNPVLPVDDELTRDDMQQFELRGDVDRFRCFDDAIDILARDLAMLPDTYTDSICSPAITSASSTAFFTASIA